MMRSFRVAAGLPVGEKRPVDWTTVAAVSWLALLVSAGVVIACLTETGREVILIVLAVVASIAAVLWTLLSIWYLLPRRGWEARGWKSW